MRSWLAIAVVGLATGCVIRDDSEDPPASTGTVDISWRMGPSGCEVSGITEVEVNIGGVGGTFDCADEAASINVPAGTYDLVLTGLDGAGDPRFGGEALDVTVNGGSTTTVPTVVLGALPATLRVFWSFENGQLCASNDVEDVEAYLFDDSSVIQSQLATSCDEAELTLEDIDAGTYTLSLSGSDESGTENFSGSVEVILERGDTSEVTVQLIAN